MRWAIICVFIIYYNFFDYLQLYELTKVNDELHDEYQFMYAGYIILFFYAMLSIFIDICKYIYNRFFD